MNDLADAEKTNPIKLEAKRRSLRVSFSQSSNRGPISKAKKCPSPDISRFFCNFYALFNHFSLFFTGGVAFLIERNLPQSAQIAQIQRLNITTAYEPRLSSCYLVPVAETAFDKSSHRKNSDFASRTRFTKHSFTVFWLSATDTI